MNDLFDAFLGRGGGGGMGGFSQRSRKGRDVAHSLPVTLEDLYNGKTVVVERRRTKICPKCFGRGSLKPSTGGGNACPMCHGSGVRQLVRQMGMMVQQMQVQCDACGGSGERIDPKNRCPECAGQKTVEVDAPVTVAVERGMGHRQAITFPRLADENPEHSTPGDFIVVLQQVKHDCFVRQECDLHLQRRISLAEALCGFQFKIKHLDGRELVIRRNRGDITKPGDVKCVVGEGMPLLRQEGRFGDMVVQFDVEYPERIDPPQIAILREALPPPPSADFTGGNEENTHVCYVAREHLDTLRREIQKEEEEDESEEVPFTNCGAQ